MDFAIPQIRVQRGFVAPASRRHFLRHAEGEKNRRRDAGATKCFRPRQNKLFLFHSLESS
jgi:hypothetical protein